MMISSRPCQPPVQVTKEVSKPITEVYERIVEAVLSGVDVTQVCFAHKS